LMTVSFQEGQFVRQGDVLAEIDKRPFENQLLQAQGQLAQAQAQQADTQNATVGQYQGSIQADQGAIAVSQAAIEVGNIAIANANLQLTYAHITAPISGRIGLRLVDQGNIVHSSDANGIAVIAQVQPIAVLFNLPEDDLGPVLQKLRSGAKLKVDAYDRDDMTKIASGTLLTADNQIDQSTGTSRLKSVFDNSDNALFPNQFVNVHLLLDVVKDATVITAAAVQRGPQGTYVYVVDADKIARIRMVTLKTTQGNDVSVGPELKPGELVVVEGTDKVQDGARVDLQTPNSQGAPGGQKIGSGRGAGEGRGGRGKRSGQ